MTTRMTMNGVSTTNGLGQEQYEPFTLRIRNKRVKRVQYDYRHTDGELFTTIQTSLKACREKRDEWLKSKSK